MKKQLTRRLIKAFKNGGFVIYLILQVVFVEAQNTGVPTDQNTSSIQDKIEQIAESSSANIDFTELIEDLKFFNEHPLNLNYATDDELERLGILNPMQIFNLKSYRENFGMMQSVFELQGIDGFDAQTIENLLPFVMVSVEAPVIDMHLKNAFKYGRHQLLMRGQTVLQPRVGYSALDDSLLLENPNSRYLGSPEKYYLRYGFNYQNRIRFGITAEKDAGEVFFSGKLNDSIQKLTGNELKTGFDFYSIHVMVNDIGPIKALAIGDYQLRFGQGLTLWSGLAFGKSADAVNVKKYSTGISPYTSTDENRFFRGAAVSLGFRRVTLSLFASDKEIDGILNSVDSLQSINENSASLYETGLHRTPNELLKKDRIKQKVFGGNLNYSGKYFQLGFTGFYSEFGNYIQKTDAVYNNFDFEGKSNINIGADYSFMLGTVNFFGEVAMSQNEGLANLHGLSVNLHPRFALALIYRNYSTTYQNYFSNGFAESYNQNEKGLFAGFRLDLSKRWFLSMYYDLFAYPWLRFSVDGPSAGNDLLVQMDYNMDNDMSMQFRLKSKLKQINQSENIGFTPNLVVDRKLSLRYQILYKLSPSLIGKNRVEYLLHKKSSDYKGLGYLIFQDVSWRPEESKTTISMRYAIFDTDSYDERIYSYESDVLYAFSIPAYYYRGSKIYLVASYTLGPRFKFWVRVSHTWLTDHNSIGSGLDLIQDNRKTEFKLMLMMKL